MIKSLYSRFLIVIFTVVLSLFLLHILTPFEIKSLFVKYVMYLGLFVLAPFITISRMLVSKKWREKGVTSFFIILILLVVSAIALFVILFTTQSWYTQTILYENKHSVYKKVELQMQDIGALGYRNREVEVTYLTSLFMFVSPVRENIDNNPEWKKVEIEVNEMGLEDY